MSNTCREFTLERTMALDQNSKDVNGQPAQLAGGAQPQGLTIRTVEGPDCQEIFADSVMGLYFDGQTLRLELGVTRFDEVKQNAPLTARRYPACRLVLSPSGAQELINRTQQIASALAQASTPRAKQSNSKPLESNLPK